MARGPERVNFDGLGKSNGMEARHKMEWPLSHCIDPARCKQPHSKDKILDAIRGAGRVFILWARAYAQGQCRRRLHGQTDKPADGSVTNSVPDPIRTKAFAGGGALAAAVSRAGGLGLIGGGYGDRTWLNDQFKAAGGERIRVSVDRCSQVSAGSHHVVVRRSPSLRRRNSECGRKAHLPVLKHGSCPGCH
jgi:hypothetical protein